MRSQIMALFFCYFIVPNFSLASFSPFEFIEFQKSQSMTIGPEILNLLKSQSPQSSQQALKNGDLDQLASSLFIANRTVFLKRRFLEDFIRSGVVKVQSIEMLAPHSHYPYFMGKMIVEMPYKGSLKESLVNLSFRSNGKVAFLTSTWQLEQEQGGPLSFQAVALRDGALCPLALSQNELILSSIDGGTIIVSRAMSETEAQLWHDNRVSEIKSKVVLMGERIETDSRKTTFALNYFRFLDREPYIFEFKKQKLVDLNRYGLLSFNTYEDRANSKNGMPEEAQTPFGLEVEMVVHGVEGQSMIQTEMSHPSNSCTGIISRSSPSAK
jgi:hypothetical protein